MVKRPPGLSQTALVISETTEQLIPGSFLDVLTMTQVATEGISPLSLKIERLPLPWLEPLKPLSIVRFTHADSLFLTMTWSLKDVVLLRSPKEGKGIQQPSIGS